MQVPCTNVIPPDQQDKRLLDKLLAEQEGIVYRMVMALKTVIANGYRLTEPSSIKAARTRYQQENSTVITFFEDCMKPLTSKDKYRLCTAMNVYSAYQGWCRDNNRGYAKTAREFKEELAAHLCITPKELTVRHKEGMVYRSYTLTPDAAATYMRGHSYEAADDDFLALEPVFPDYLN